MQLLIVEDDPVLANGLMQALQNASFMVTHESNGKCADQVLTMQQFDLVILDLGLPDMDGSEVLQRLRQRGSSVPVLVLTARNTLSDRVQGLDYGADDYLAKPFDLRELEARVRALLRRGQVNVPLQLSGLCLDPDGLSATLHNQPLDLVARELSVLKILLLSAGSVVSKEKMCEQLGRQGEEVSVNALEVYVHRLRKKLEPGGINIRTLRGLGYMLEMP